MGSEEALVLGAMDLVLVAAAGVRLYMLLNKARVILGLVSIPSMLMG